MIQREACAMAKIRPNRVKQKLAAGEVVLSVSGLDTPDLIDLMGPIGLDDQDPRRCVPAG
jgi:hypothetical protein